MTLTNGCKIILVPVIQKKPMSPSIGPIKVPFELTPSSPAISRRDAFVKAAMQGLLAGNQCEGSDLAWRAIQQADRAIAQLDALESKPYQTDEIDRMRQIIYQAHTDLGSVGGISEPECSCEDCATYRAHAEKS